MKKSVLKVVSSTKDSYTKTRHNAVRHGVLSNIDVLPWEDANELQNLKQGFLNDFKPQGASETYLVEELAIIAFRKKRLYKAENALITRELKNIGTNYNLDNVYESANLLSDSIHIKERKNRETSSLKESLYPDSEEDNKNLAHYQKYIGICESVINQETISYEEALETFPQDLTDHWQNCLTKRWVDSEDKLHIKTIESLKRFLQENVIENFSQRKNLIEAKDHIKQQAIGMAYVPNSAMESLQRYEVTLDRCFERKLSVLLKLQDIRNNKSFIFEA